LKLRRFVEAVAQHVAVVNGLDAGEATFNTGAYVTHGGFRAIDKVFAGQGRALLGELEVEIWGDAA